MAAVDPASTATDHPDNAQAARGEAIAAVTAILAPRLSKRRYLQAEHGDGVDIMRAIKQALDPDHIMNPGKIF